MSDLLNQASLVMVPSGYKEDTVYSVVPSDGSGDLSFTRASNGTRVNSAGLVEVCPWNLADQSNTFGTSPWANTLDTGATLTYTANYGTAPDGTTTAGRLQMALNGSAYAQKNQIISVITGQQYTYSVWIKSLSGTKDVIFCYDNTNNITASVTTEWQRFTHTFTGNSQVYARFVLEAGTSTSVDLLIYGAQLNIGATAKPYFPTTDRLNVPRLTYQNGGGGCPSLLLEKQSTNEASYSEQFDNAYWTKQGLTVTANSIVSPDGTQNADLLTLNTSLEEHNAYAPASGLTITSNAPFTFSCYVKKGTGRYFCTATYFTGVGFGPYATFDLNTATLVASGASFGTYSSSKIENMGNDWYRCSVTGFGPYTSLIFAPDIRSASSLIPGVPFTGAGETMYVWGAQLEASSYATSYIPTTSSSATRVADACFKTGISSLIGGGTGTWFMDFEMVQGAGSEYPFAFDLSDGTTSNRLYLYWSEPSQTWNWGGVDTAITLPSTLRKKVAVKFSSGTGKLFCNGSLISTLSLSTAWSRLDIGQRFSDTFPMDGKINQAYFLTTSLTDAQCQAITTI